jgi:hypothetical protein
MRCCVPCQTVPVRELENLLGAFGAVHASLQSQMIRFVVSVLDHVDSVSSLRRLYAVFFHWLDYAELRPYLAHVLVRITLREHCVPFRVRRLAALLKRSPNDRALIALAAVFQCYAPLDIAVPANKVVADAATFAGAHAVDQAAWVAEIALARSRAGASAEPLVGVPLRALADISRGLATHGAPASTAVVTIDDVDTAATLVESLDRIELPDRMSAVLSNEWLQHYVALAPSESALMRVQQWLAFSLDDRARWRSGGDAESLFAALAQLTVFVGETLPVVERFLGEYLRTASADANFTLSSDSTLFSLLTLVEYVHPMPFEQLHARILSPLQSLFYSGGVSVKSRILACVRRLCVHWAGVEWAEVRAEALRVPDEGGFDLTMLLKRYAIGGVKIRFDHLATLQALVRFNERLCVLALQAHRHHALLQHQALATFEVFVRLHRHYHVPFCCVPPMALVTSALFSNNASAVSRVCSLIVELASEVTAMRSESAQSKAMRQGSVVSSGVEHKERVNDFLLHLSALLWQKGLFAEDKSRKGGAGNARGFRATFGLSNESVAALQARFGSETIESFGVARHPALAPFAAEFARSVGDAAANGDGDSPTTLAGRKRRAASEPAALVQEQRKQFVTWLAQEEQLTGIERFLTEFTMMKAR